MTQTVAILGATGRLGHAAAEAFQAAGYHVRCITRDGRSVLPGPEAVRANAMNPAELRAALAVPDIVFNALNPLYTDWHRLALPMTQNVMDALRDSGALHLFPGNVYNFGSPMPPVLREDAPQRPTAEKGKIRNEMEEMFRREAGEHGTQTVILRAGDFFGGGPGSWFDLILTSKLAKGIFTAPGPMNVAHAWAYLPDLAATFVGLVGVRDRLRTFEVLHFPGHTTTLAGIKSALETATRRPLKTSNFPWWAIRASAIVCPMGRELAEMRYLWNDPHQLAPDRLQALGCAVAATPLQIAITKTVSEELLKVAA